MVSVWQASACNTDTTPTSHTETPTHIETVLQPATRIPLQPATPKLQHTSKQCFSLQHGYHSNQPHRNSNTYGNSASACNTDTTPTSHTETPTHMETVLQPATRIPLQPATPKLQHIWKQRFSLPHGYHPNQPHRNSNTYRNKNTQPM